MRKSQTRYGDIVRGAQSRFRLVAKLRGRSVVMGIIIYAVACISVHADGGDFSLKAEDFTLYRSSDGEEVVSLGDDVWTFVASFGPPVSEDPIETRPTRAAMTFDGFRLTYGTVTNEVVVIVVLDNTFETNRNITVGDPWESATAAYPRGFFRHDDTFIYGHYNIPDSFFGSQYFLRVVESDTRSVGRISFGLTIQ